MNQKFYKILCNSLSATGKREIEYLINPAQVSLITPIFYRDDKGNYTDAIKGSVMRLSDGLSLVTKLKPDELVEMFSK